VSVALGIQHAMRMSHIVICGLSGFTVIFPHYLINNSAPTAEIFMKFDISVFFGNMSETFMFRYNFAVTGTSHKGQYKFIIISR